MDNFDISGYKKCSKCVLAECVNPMGLYISSVGESTNWIRETPPSELGIASLLGKFPVISPTFKTSSLCMSQMFLLAMWLGMTLKRARHCGFTLRAQVLRMSHRNTTNCRWLQVTDFRPIRGEVITVLPTQRGDASRFSKLAWAKVNRREKNKKFHLVRHLTHSQSLTCRRGLWLSHP